MLSDYNLYEGLAIKLMKLLYLIKIIKDITELYVEKRHICSLSNKKFMIKSVLLLVSFI